MFIVDLALEKRRVEKYEDAQAETAQAEVIAQSRETAEQAEVVVEESVEKTVDQPAEETTENPTSETGA